MNTRLAARRLPSPTTVLTLVFVLCLAPLLDFGSSAQTTTTGVIEGTLVDVNGAAVSDATVTVAAKGGPSVSTMTDGDGVFRITQLKPGQYTVTVEAPGFSKFEQQNVEVNLSKSTKLNLSLNPAPISGGDESVAATGTRIPQPELTASKPFTELPLTNYGGTRVASLATIQGLLKLALPDDMRPGDTISGSLTTEPKGANDQEKATNNQVLQTFVIDIDGTRVGFGSGPFSFGVPANAVKPGEFTAEGKMDMRIFQPSKPNEVWKINVPYTIPTTPSGAVVTPDPKVTVPKTESGAVVTPDPKITPPTAFTIPHLGQQGRPIEIFGPFDGDASNTRLRAEQQVDKALRNPSPIDPPGAKEFVDQFSNENFMKGLTPVAESPRKAVFIAPSNLTGPFNIALSEAGIETKGNYRNVAVNLSAPKTNLNRGEKTTVHVEVKGLQGIINDVPLQLDARGVITMDGGNFQNLRIKPEEVKLDGRYTTDRGITGLSAGGFSVTATVIVGPFDVCLQDDLDPNRRFRWNTFTGDYAFTNPAPPKTPGGTVQAGGTTTGGTAAGGSGTPPPVTPPTGLPGMGKPAMKGCLITLSHNAPDRRIFARLDVCTKSGDATVETKSPKANFNITDKNTSDNPTSPPPPPK